MNNFKKTLLIAMLLAGAASPSSAADRVVTALEAEAHKSTRTKVLYIENHSSEMLVRTEVQKHHGAWVGSPAETINPGSWSVFGNVSSGVMTGCEGEITYLAVPSLAKIKLHWGNPFVGTGWSRYNLENPGAHTLTESGTGNDVLRYYFR